jgi:hypothetical protein
VAGIYLKLKNGEIRLLTIGKCDGVLHCTLIETEPENTDFESLSNSRGPYEADPPLTKCNGIDFGVRSNLYHALLELQKSPSHILPVWIDAICINQNDTAEKEMQQLPLMRQIYKQAKLVLVWLGKDDKHSDLAMDNAEDLAGKLAAIVPCKLVPTRLVNGGLEARESPIWTAIGDLCRCDWCGREYGFFKQLA